MDTHGYITSEKIKNVRFKTRVFLKGEKGLETALIHTKTRVNLTRGAHLV